MVTTADGVVNSNIISKPQPPPHQITSSRPFKRRGGTYVENVFLDDLRLDIYTKSLLITMHRCAGRFENSDKGQEEGFYQLQEVLAELSGMSLAQVERCVRKLKDLGYIEVHKFGLPARNFYKIMHQDVAEEHLFKWPKKVNPNLPPGLMPIEY